MPVRDHLENIYARLRINPVAALLTDISLGMILAPVYALLNFKYLMQYGRLRRQALAKRKKMVIISLSHISEKRFVEKLIVKLKNDPRIQLAFFCGHQSISRSDIGSHYPNIPVFPYGILPFIKAHLFLTTKTSLAWHKPFLTKKIHIFHSPVSIHQIYAEDCFDAFDGFFASGPHHKKELRVYMPKRGRDVKIFETGSEVIDTLLHNPLGNEKYAIKTVIYAPSWGEQSSLAINGKDIISKLLVLGIKVIFRPHSLSYKTQKGLIDGIKGDFSGNNRFLLDKTDNSNLIEESVDLMVSDWSGAAFEFALGYQKPVIFIDTPQKILNKNWFKYLPEQGIEFGYRNQLGVIIKEAQELEAAIDYCHKNYAEFNRKIVDCSKEILYHPGNSVDYAYPAVLEMLKLTAI